MAYPEFLIAPMREELTDVGFTELRTAADVDRAVAEKGTTMVVVNSVCGCAAGKARPGIARAMQHATRPDHAVTVFAGADIEATERARGYLHGLPALVAVGGHPARRQAGLHHGAAPIEGNTADGIAAALTAAFDKYCATQNA